MSAALEHVRDLADFVTESPTSFHAAAEVARRLVDEGFGAVDERAGFVAAPASSYVLVRDGAVLAWRIPAGAGPGTPYRIVGAHTDSPGFVLKPRPDVGTAGWQQLGMEIYGGPLLNSWLDRELGLAGRVILTSGEQRLVQTGPIMRIPQLAIHLDRSANEEGVKLDRQLHTPPVWSVGRPDLQIMEQIAAAGRLRGRRHRRFRPVGVRHHAAGGLRTHRRVPGLGPAGQPVQRARGPDGADRHHRQRPDHRRRGVRPRGDRQRVALRGRRPACWPTR